MHKQEVLPKRGHWHLIGHLQTNKAKHAVEHFDLIESADSAKILTHLDRAAEQVGKVQDVLLQINEAGESQKSGFQPADFRAIVKRWMLILICVSAASWSLPRQRTRWKKRVLFSARGMRISLFLRDALKHEDVNILSMGMTHDYWIAVEEGANEIRVGSALFGARDYTLKF